MSSLVESGKYGAINTTYTSTNGFYVIMFTSGAYTLQENITIDGQILIAGELVVNAKYLCSMQVDTNWYWNYTTLFRSCGTVGIDDNSIMFQLLKAPNTSQ